MTPTDFRTVVEIESLAGFELFSQAAVSGSIDPGGGVEAGGTRP